MCVCECKKETGVGERHTKRRHTDIHKSIETQTQREIGEADVGV